MQMQGRIAIFWLVVLFFNIFGDDFGERSKTEKIVLFRVKFRRRAQRAEKLRFNPNKIKLVYDFILRLVYKLMVKHLKLNLTKINYEFFKTPHKEPSQNSRKHAVG